MPLNSMMTYYDFDFNIESIAEFLYLRKMIILTLDVIAQNNIFNGCKIGCLQNCKKFKILFQFKFNYQFNKRKLKRKFINIIYYNVWF